MPRQFDVCHNCRRCFNLCDAFPRLFDLIDNSSTSELDAVPSDKLGSVAQACALCDMCVKCPYLPPHPFNIDFPHLMLPAQIASSRDPKTTVLVSINHPRCSHIAMTPDTVRAALAEDFTP